MRDLIGRAILPDLPLMELRLPFGSRSKLSTFMKARCFLENQHLVLITDNHVYILCSLFKSTNIIYLQSSTDYNETDEKGIQNGGQTSYSCMEQRPSRQRKDGTPG